jgi:hypothetical protein
MRQYGRLVALVVLDSLRFFPRMLDKSIGRVVFPRETTTEGRALPFAVFPAIYRRRAVMSVDAVFKLAVLAVETWIQT